MKIYRTCFSEELQALTALGWALDKVMDGDRVTTRYEMVIVPNNPHSQQVTKSETLKTQTYLLWQESEGLGPKVERLESDLNLAKMHLSERKYVAEKSEKDLKEKVDKLKAELILVDHKNETLLGEVAKARKVNEAMETDLGKVREAVGAIRMKEILGGR